MCVIRSMQADVPNHEPSLLLMNCGEARLIRPSMGSWVTYGLGSENQNLPGFIAMCPGGYPIQETQNWQCGFLPGAYQGTYIDTRHTTLKRLVEHVRNPSLTREQPRRQLDLLRELNQRHLERDVGRRARPDADGGVAATVRKRGPHHWPRSQPLRIHDVACRRRRQGRAGVWGHRRIWLPGGGAACPRPRPTRDTAAPAR